MAIYAEGLGFQTYTTAAAGTTATQIFYGLGQGGTAISGSGTAAVLRNPTVENVGTATIYIGSTSVTTATGYPLLAGQQVVFNTEPGTAASLQNTMYGICAAGLSTTVNSGYATQFIVS